MSRIELKAAAKKSLEGKYGTFIGAMVIYVIVVALINGLSYWLIGLFDVNINKYAISIVAGLISFFITALLAVGISSMTLKIARGEEVGVDELFSRGAIVFTYIIASILIAIFTSLWSLLLIIPGIIAAYSYMMTNFVIIDNPKMGALEAIGESKKIMYGHKLDFFILNLSFIGWAILAPFTLGILNFWLVPYMNVTYAKFYDAIKSNA